MSAINLDRFRRQLESCMSRNVTRPKPLTGIEKHFLEQQDAPKMDEIDVEYQREFGKPQS